MASNSFTVQNAITADYEMCHALFTHGWIGIDALCVEFGVSREVMKKRTQRVIARIEARGIEVLKRKVVPSMRGKNNCKYHMEWRIDDHKWRNKFTEDL